jgi:hypothetical protein
MFEVEPLAGERLDQGHADEQGTSDNAGSEQQLSVPLTMNE